MFSSLHPPTLSEFTNNQGKKKIMRTNGKGRLKECDRELWNFLKTIVFIQKTNKDLCKSIIPPNCSSLPASTNPVFFLLIYIYHSSHDHNGNQCLCAF